jgi:apolipoprotein N-acyltransferase
VTWGASLAILPLLLLYGFGAWRLAGAPAPMLDGVRIRIVQASIDQRDKWRPEKQGEIFQEQLNLSRHDASGRRDDLAGITHLVWPEAAMPFLPLEHPEAIAAIGELLPNGTQLISGALRLKRPATPQADGAHQGYNSLMIFAEQGNLETIYDKIHLVPFGEYLPFQPMLEAIGLEQLTRWRGGWSSTPRPLCRYPARQRSRASSATTISLRSCRSATPGPVNVTNDGWFGDTTGPPAFHQAVRWSKRGAARAVCQ